MLKFNEKSHLYTWDNKPVPSVTQVMSRVGVRKDDESPFKAISGNFIVGSETASNFGRAFHKLAEIVVKGGNPACPVVMHPWLNGLNMFLKDHKKDLEIIRTELCHYSEMYKYAGTMDVYGMYKGVPIIIDWKTSTQVSKTWDLQTAAYEQLGKEYFDTRKRHHRWAVRIYENGYEVVKRYNHSTDFNKFLSILNVYRTFA
jgi:hypothetical protein